MVTLSWVFLNTGQDTLNQSFCWECTARQITSCMVEEWVTTDRPLETMQPNNNIAVEQDAGREERTNHHNGRVSESQSGLSLTVQPPPRSPGVEPNLSPDCLTSFLSVHYQARPHGQDHWQHQAPNKQAQPPGLVSYGRTFLQIINRPHKTQTSSNQTVVTVVL